MKKKIKFIIVLLILVIVVSAVVVFIIKKENANAKVIKVSGNIEGDTVRISFRVEGQITELLTDEGMVIKKEDIVARLNKDELSKVKAQAEAELKFAEYQYKLDYDDYVRAQNLLKAGAISAQNRDQAKTKMETDLAEIKKLRASLELTNTKLGWTDLASPLDGYVLVKSALPGEVVQAGAAVFTAINLRDLWVTAYINETDLAKVKLGQKAYAQTDSYPGKKYDGRVSFISDQTEFTPKNIQTTEERVKYVYRIKVKVDNSSLDLKPGMPIDAYIMIQ
ncbi:MAG: efflux RND transporter periplasmic adaptor subunit [Candidatus Omnitrophica bacterium]|nr:efflux RND transporter periplasmic adaptor subunit [Candidatus Omnitrophota bacterium]MDD5238630.1 efflux RND transporter periplasmic adaptor subunit [Candidatus Omnitrophota bacterium]